VRHKVAARTHFVHSYCFSRHKAFLPPAKYSVNHDIAMLFSIGLKPAYDRQPVVFSGSNDENDIE